MSHSCVQYVFSLSFTHGWEIPQLFVNVYKWWEIWSCQCCTHHLFTITTYLYTWVNHAFPHERTCASIRYSWASMFVLCSSRNGAIYWQHELLLALFILEYDMYCRAGNIDSQHALLLIFYSWVQNVFSRWKPLRRASGHYPKIVEKPIEKTAFLFLNTTCTAELETFILNMKYSWLYWLKRKHTPLPSEWSGSSDRE